MASLLTYISNGVADVSSPPSSPISSPVASLTASGTNLTATAAASSGTPWQVTLTLVGLGLTSTFTLGMLVLLVYVLLRTRHGARFRGWALKVWGMVGGKKVKEVEMEDRACRKGGTHIGSVISKGCLRCKVVICEKCGFCMTKLFDTKTKLDFKTKNYGRHQSLNALRVQASCGNELCQYRAVLPPPGSPRCNCTEILVNDLHHERCTTGHFCEVCFWYVLESLRKAKYMEYFVNDSNSKWKAYACDCGKSCDYHYPVICRLCGLFCYHFTLNGKVYGDSRDYSESRLPEGPAALKFKCNTGDAHYYLHSESLQGPALMERLRGMGLPGYRRPDGRLPNGTAEELEEGGLVLMKEVRQLLREI